MTELSMQPGEELKQEAELVRRARKGDREAFGQLVCHLQRTIYALVLQRTSNSDAAADLTQTVFLEAFRSLPKLRKPEKFRPWLYRIASRTGRRWLKRNRRARELQEIASETTAKVGEAGIAEKLVREELKRAVLEAVGELPDKYRIVITMRYVEELSCARIARLLDEPAGTVRSRLTRAHARLKKKLARWL